MDALILAGGHGTDLQPLTVRTPKHLLPVANRPALAYALESLSAAGLRRVAITVNGDEKRYREALGDGSRYGVRLQYLRETSPQGTAGCLRGALEREWRGPLLVLSGNLFHSIDLREVLEVHRASQAAATVCVTRCSQAGSRRSQRERAVLGPQGELVELTVTYGEEAQEPELRPAGMYVFERHALERIPRRVYYDLKEQFLPDLLRSGLPVHTHPLTGYHREVDRVEDYLAIHYDLLRGRTGLKLPGEELPESVWLQGEALLPPEAIVVGPLVLGPGVRVAADARLIGPVVLGAGTEVGPGALVRESVVGEGVRIGPRAIVEGCVVGDGARVAEGTSLSHSVAVGESITLGELNLMERDLSIQTTAVPVRRYLGARLRRAAHSALKRAFDVAFASAALVLSLLVMAVVAAAIRWDSEGPVLFRQIRCGRGGRKFDMLKFRSMRADAPDLQATLRERNESDGPVFKITDDPRLTRVGRVLRKYSLDELPQLWNVVRGEMSVVGPRPLAEAELRLCPSWRDARSRVKPGLTGLWQVSSREDNAFHNWIRHDLRYVRSQSLLLDMKIVLRTVAALAKGL